MGILEVKLIPKKVYQNDFFLIQVKVETAKEDMFLYNGEQLFYDDEELIYKGAIE